MSKRIPGRKVKVEFGGGCPVASEIVAGECRAEYHSAPNLLIFASASPFGRVNFKDFMALGVVETPVGA